MLYGINLIEIKCYVTIITTLNIEPNILFSTSLNPLKTERIHTFLINFNLDSYLVKPNIASQPTLSR